MKLKKVPLHEYHRTHANLVDFHGYEMPLWYDGIVREHLAVRNSVGIFDISHMGRGLVSGPDTTQFLNFIFTYDVTEININHAWITSMCDERGIIIDDMMVYNIGEEKYFVVFNCLKIDQDRVWVSKQLETFDAKFIYVSDQTAQFAVQGPQAERTIQKITDMKLSKLDWFEGSCTTIAGCKAYISRTGYTGEDGFEIYIWNTSQANPEKALKIWTAILVAGQEFNIMPCGLGARDSTRIEAGFWLEGNECNGSKVTPQELGLKWVVSLKKPTFIGREALLKQYKKGITIKRIGIRMLEKGIPRRDYDILKNGEKIGQVTSGTFSPILNCGIAMGYVPTKYSIEGSIVEVKIRNKFVTGKIVKFPFYDVTQYGRLRRKKL